MTQRTLMLDEVEGRRAGDLLREVVRSHEVLTVVLEDGQTVMLRPSQPLEPLPTLEGSVPEGWKNAIYSA